MSELGTLTTPEALTVGSNVAELNHVESLEPYENTLLSRLDRRDTLFKQAARRWGRYVTCNPHFGAIYQAWQSNDAVTLATALKDHREPLTIDLEDFRPDPNSNTDVWVHHVLTDLMYREPSERNWKLVRKAQGQMLLRDPLDEQDADVSLNDNDNPEDIGSASQSLDTTTDDYKRTIVFEYSMPHKPSRRDHCILDDLKPVTSICDLMGETADYLCSLPEVQESFRDEARTTRRTVELLRDIKRNGGKTSELKECTFFSTGGTFLSDLATLREAGERAGLYRSQSAQYILRYLTRPSQEVDWNILPAIASDFSEGRYTFMERSPEK